MALSSHDMIGNQTATAAQSLRRGGAMAATLALTCGLLAAALGCVVAALWLAVSPYLGPALAALISVFALLIMAGLSLLLARQMILRPVRQSAALSPASLSQAFSADKASWLSAALVAGLVAGGRQN